MRLPVVLALAALAALAPATSCARKSEPAPNPLVEKGRQSYAKYCATCHGPAANGYIADNAPSLRAVTFLESASDEFIRAGISRGRPGTAMAAFASNLGGPLDPPEVDAIIAFLRVGRAGASARCRRARSSATSKRGKVVYDANCARCHGTPTQRSSAVHLANPVLLATATDAFLRWAVERGRPPTSMVPWKGALTPVQIDDVVAFVRSMAVPPAVPALPPVTPRRSRPRRCRRARDRSCSTREASAPEFVLKEDLYVPIDQVKKALDGKRRLIIADARAPSDWLNLHITGAISTPYYDKRTLDDIPNDGTWVLAYCACPHHVSGEVVAELRKRGYKHTAVIDEGVFAWQQAKYPVVTAPGLLPAAAPPPQHH